MNTSQEIADKVAIRNNCLKIFVVVGGVIILCVKLWQADFSQAFAAFDFSDLLTLFLALFSIALSVLFYFKATDTSNVFYDNTYRFTKEVSEILGRLEAGFGERLRHLDEGYSNLRSTVEKIPFDRQQAEEKIAEEERQLQKVEKKREELIEGLASKAQLEEEEKQKFFQQLVKQDKELSSARQELHFLQRRLETGSRTSPRHRSLPSELRTYLRRMILTSLPADLLMDAPLAIINRRLKAILRDEEHPTAFIKGLKKHDIVDEDLDLTPTGLSILQEIAVEIGA